MTENTFVLNNVSFAKFVDRYSYTTTYEPVVGGSVTTMDMVDHETISRWRGTVSFKTVPMTTTEYARFCKALQAVPISCRYTCQQRGTVVSARMKNTRLQAAHGLRNENRTIIGPMAVTLTEM